MFVYVILDFIVGLLTILLSIAILTLFERKVMGSIQRRRGPNVVGFFGLFQPFADGFKLLLKETVIPRQSEQFLFCLAPLFSFGLSLASWSLIPFGNSLGYLNVNNNILLVLGISSLGVYGLILSGWSSNSKYAFLGSLRASAQLLAYEICVALVLIPIFVLSASLNMVEIVSSQRIIGWYLFVFVISAIMFLVCGLAETNRTPFDLPEAEGELVAGYNVEYSSMSFALFFLAEYSNILLYSALFSILFLGGWNKFLFLPVSFSIALKICMIVYIFIWVRATLPRYRFDQLISIGWQVLLPISLGYFLVVIAHFFVITHLF